MQILLLNASGHPQSIGSLLESLNDEDLLASIVARVLHVADKGGNPQPPTAKPIRGANINLCEIRVPYPPKNLLRIYYFVDKTKKNLVLLNTIIKPDGTKSATKYEGKNKKKIDKEIEKSIDIAIQLHKNYLTKKTNYDFFPF